MKTDRQSSSEPDAFARLFPPDDRQTELHPYATLIVLADESAASSIKESIMYLVRECGVLVVNVGKLTKHQMKGKCRTRWRLVYDYFRLNLYRFERFTMTDEYDSFFQGDVFLKSVRADTLYFSTESITVGNCPYNSAWITDFFPAAVSQMAAQTVVCAAPIVGCVLLLIRLCKVMFSLPKWTFHWRTPPDQVYINYVVRSSRLDTADVPYVIVPNDGFITTVGYCDKKGDLARDANSNVECPSFKTTPMLLHQYIRPKNMRRHMFRVCAADDMSLAFKVDPYNKASF
jgi:hypothetical protein